MTTPAPHITRILAGKLLVHIKYTDSFPFTTDELLAVDSVYSRGLKMTTNSYDFRNKLN